MDNQPNQYQQQQYSNQPGGTQTLSIVSLIFGIVGVILTFTPASIVGLILLILGLVFSSMGKRREGRNGFATGGFIISLVGIILWVIIVVIVGIVVGMAFGALGALGAAGALF
ncbi:MAG TPA: hypothetical protein DEB31_09380 [Clostridiales bacterium]|nr:hypothetical protein [Clostridiales bacterium]